MLYAHCRKVARLVMTLAKPPAFTGELQPPLILPQKGDLHSVSVTLLSA